MSLILTAVGGYSLDFDDLYARLWDLAEEESDGTRVYTSAGDQALKWLIAEAAGTPAESGQTLPANNELRQQVHAVLVDGWAERINQRRFRLLIHPVARGGVTADARPFQTAPAAAQAGDVDDEGAAVTGVSEGAVVGHDGRLTLGGLDWSRWVALTVAAAEATTSPGVYAARSEGQLVYIGMAGERRGQGVRGRLRVYARGRGAVSGLGEALLDRALADPVWVRERLTLLEAHGGERVTAWARTALSRRPLQVAWASCTSAAEARVAERAMLVDLEDVELWNRARP